MKPIITPLIAEPWPDYALLDSGHGRKLERYGCVLVDRPEPQALWAPSLAPPIWETADARFVNAGDEESETGKWHASSPSLPQSWPVAWGSLSFVCRLMSFRHMGLFPEQMAHWRWAAHHIRESKRKSEGPFRLLNLFAYTGAASLSAAQNGASVVHVDASKKAIQWAKDNQAASSLSGAPIRWICEDVRAFLAREIRRGNQYDGIILDPPKFGRGPEGEKWELDAHLPDLLSSCTHLLSPSASFLILSAYAMRLSCLSLGLLLEDVLGPRGGKIESGELLIRQENADRFLSTSLYARWEKERLPGSCEV